MSDLQPLYDALQKADAAGDTAGASKLADYIRTQTQPKAVQSFDSLGDGTVVPSGSPAAQAAQSPTSGMSTFDKFAAGYGKAAMDLGRGAGQMTGLESRQDVADSRALDAPLMATGAGKWGNIAGNIADTLPLAMIPGANTLAGAGAIGAGTGLVQPSTSTGETLANTGLGGAAGPLSLLAGRAVGAAGKGLKAALWDPFTEPGQNRIAAQTLQAFAGGPQAAQDAAKALANPPSMLPGIQPTTAELTNNAGLAQLQKTLSSNPELMNQFTQRAQGNRTAMTQAIQDIAGTPTQRASAVDLRSAMTSPLYSDAAKVTIPANADLGKLLARPSMSQAWDRAQSLAAERGESLTEPLPPNANQISGKAIQYLKMGLNDLITSGPQQGMGAHEQQALKSTLGSFNDWTMKNVPLLRAADRSYAEMSGPINQQDVGQALSNKLLPALSDFGNNTRLNANSYATGMRNGDALAADATGRPNATLSSVLNPAQMRSLNQVGEQLARTANAAELGAPKGSPTAQNLISQNVVRQFAGPLGLPNGMASRIAQGAIGRTLARPIQWGLSAAEPDVMHLLGNASLDPAKAAQFLTAIQKQNPTALALWRRQGLLGPLGGQAARGLLVDSSQ